MLQVMLPLQPSAQARGAAKDSADSTVRIRVRLDPGTRPEHPRGHSHAGHRGAAVNLFDRWTPVKEFAAALDRAVGGTPVEDIVGEDRNR